MPMLPGELVTIQGQIISFLENYITLEIKCNVCTLGKRLNDYLLKVPVYTIKWESCKVLHSWFMNHKQTLTVCYSAFICNQKHQMFKIKSVRMLDAFLQKGCKMIETFVTLKSIWAFWSHYWLVRAQWNAVIAAINGTMIFNVWII